jgi:hypothetical protein
LNAVADPIWWLTKDGDRTCFALYLCHYSSRKRSRHSKLRQFVGSGESKADAIADHSWPGERHYTKVRPGAIRSCNPGFCFIAAGWRRCGMTKGGLVILERVL